MDTNENRAWPPEIERRADRLLQLPLKERHWQWLLNPWRPVDSPDFKAVSTGDEEGHVPTPDNTPVDLSSQSLVNIDSDDQEGMTL